MNKQLFTLDELAGIVDTSVTAGMTLEEVLQGIKRNAKVDTLGAARAIVNAAMKNGLLAKNRHGAYFSPEAFPDGYPFAPNAMNRSEITELQKQAEAAVFEAVEKAERRTREFICATTNKAIRDVDHKAHKLRNAFNAAFSLAYKELTTPPQEVTYAHPDDDYAELMRAALKAFLERRFGEYSTDRIKRVRHLTIGGETGDRRCVGAMICDAFYTPKEITTDLLTARNRLDLPKWRVYRSACKALGIPYMAYETYLNGGGDIAGIEELKNLVKAKVANESDIAEFRAKQLQFLKDKGLA